MRQKECIAMLLAGGEGRRLNPLTLHKAKPAVHFGGTYRMIDFALSNCTNSGISTIGVVTQYKAATLHDHIGTGTSWLNGGYDGEIKMLPPGDDQRYEGTADAIYQNKTYIDQHHPEHVLVLSGDHIYRMDFQQMLEQHKRSNADVTLAVTPVKWEEAHRFGIIDTDTQGMVIRFTEKPAKPQSNLASMGIYIFNKQVMDAFLEWDQSVEGSSRDFGKDVLPEMLRQGAAMYTYSFEGYWRDVGTIESLWGANMELLDEPKLHPWHADGSQVYTSYAGNSPHYVNKSLRISQSVVSQGCSISGKVERSILSADVKIGEGSVIKNSVIMPGVIIGNHVTIQDAIIGEGSYIGDGVKLAGSGGEIAVIGEQEAVMLKPQRAARRMFPSSWGEWVGSTLPELASRSQKV